MLVLCWITRCVPYRKQELLTLHDHLDPPPGFGAVRVAHPFSFLFLCFALSSSCVLCAQCCQFLWLVHSCLPLWYYLTFICRWNRAFNCVKHPLRDRNISLLWTDSLNRMNKTNTHVLSLTNGHNKTRTAINCFLHGD